MRLLKSMLCAAVTMIVIGLLAVYTPREYIEIAQDVLIGCLFFGGAFGVLTMFFYDHFDEGREE